MRTLLLWLVPVALAAPAHKLVSIQVEPSKVALDGKWSAQQILVTGTYSDGTLHDVTPQAAFKSSAAKIAASSASGLITPVGDGKATLTISVKGAKKVVIPVTVKRSHEVMASWANNVRPLLTKLGCNATACHGSRAGKGGLRLSLFGGDPDADYDALTRASGGRRIDRVDPANSLLLLKAENAVAHGGGKVAVEGSAAHDILLAWLKNGASKNGGANDAAAKAGSSLTANAPVLTGIRVAPSLRDLAKGATQQFLVTAVFSGGLEQDVTHEAIYHTSDPQVVEISSSVARAQGYGEVSVAVTYLGQAAVTLLRVPQPLPVVFPKLDATNHVDELVSARLKLLGIPPSDRATDQEFLRRVYLDTIGVLPTAKEARAFYADTAADKRAKLIDGLLRRDEYADFWALKWSDL